MMTNMGVTRQCLRTQRPIILVQRLERGHAGGQRLTYNDRLCTHLTGSVHLHRYLYCTVIYCTPSTQIWKIGSVITVQMYRSI